MGKRRKGNRNRLEAAKHHDNPPIVIPPKPATTTFKSILEKSRGDNNNPSDPNRSDIDDSIGAHSLVSRHEPIPKEFYAPIPHVESRWELRLPERRKGPYHYALWRDAYDSYLWVLFDGFQNILNKFKVFLEEEISFETFSFFIYEISSGYISPYS